MGSVLKITSIVNKLIPNHIKMIKHNDIYIKLTPNIIEMIKTYSTNVKLVGRKAQMNF